MGLGIYSMTMENLPQEQHRMNDTYVKAIQQAGGIPVVIPSYEDLSLVKELISRLDGVLLSGGGDLDPALYSRRPTPIWAAFRPGETRRRSPLPGMSFRKQTSPFWAFAGVCR